LWVITRRRSIAQPSPPGRSAGVSPGKKRHTSAAVSWWSRYSISGSKPGGSEPMPACSGAEMSMKRRAMFGRFAVDKSRYARAPELSAGARRKSYAAV
jgi:hypothetical protein